MEINYFDIVVSIIILFLGLKGIINGFFKEIFGLVGIIGGIFIASRFGDNIGKLLNDLIFNFDNSSAVSFTGFIVVLIVFWFVMVLVGMMFKKLTVLSGLGVFDKILGFVFGASKFFFIAAVIAHASYNINAVKSLIDDTSSLKNSVLFPILTQTGSYIMKLDPVEISKDINATTLSLKNKATELVDKSTQAITDDTVEQIKDSMTNTDK